MVPVLYNRICMICVGQAGFYLGFLIGGCSNFWAFWEWLWSILETVLGSYSRCGVTERFLGRVMQC